MSSYITVLVLDSKTNRGKSGVAVSSSESSTINTDNNGQVNLSFSGNKAQIYVDGKKIYDDFLSKCPNPLTYLI